MNYMELYGIVIKYFLYIYMQTNILLYFRNEFLK